MTKLAASEGVDHLAACALGEGDDGSFVINQMVGFGHQLWWWWKDDSCGSDNQNDVFRTNVKLIECCIYVISELCMGRGRNKVICWTFTHFLHADFLLA